MVEKNQNVVILENGIYYFRKQEILKPVWLKKTERI